MFTPWSSRLRFCGQVSNPFHKIKVEKGTKEINEYIMIYSEILDRTKGKAGLLKKRRKENQTLL